MIDAEAKVREGLQDALDPAYYERFLDDLLARLSDAESMDRRHTIEMTSIHNDMLALAALVGVHYDGLSSPAGFLHAAIMPRLGDLQEERHRAVEEANNALRAMHDWDDSLSKARQGISDLKEWLDDEGWSVKHGEPTPDEIYAATVAALDELEVGDVQDIHPTDVEWGP